MMPPAMSATPAMRAGVQLSLNNKTPNAKARMDFEPDHPKIGDGEVFPLHRQRLQGGPDYKEGKDDHGRPKLGEPLRELHEDAADGEEKRGSHDHGREHRRPHSPLSTYSAATM